MQIRKAARQFRYLKIGIGGIANSGKTFGALRLAYGICGDWNRVCVIDTENNSADLYAHLGPFDCLPLGDCSPTGYIAAIDHVVKEKRHDVLIIDSLSHEWSGKDGAISLADKIASTSKSGNTFTAWAKVTPVHNNFVDAWLLAPIHLIGTMRKKDEYVITENEKGKKEPRRVGLKNIQRDGIEYEFDLFFDISQNHFCEVSKDRTQLFDGKPPFELTESVGVSLKEWSTSEKENLPEPAKTDKIYEGTPEQQQKVADYLKSAGIAEDKWEAVHNALLGKPASEFSAIVGKFKNA